MKKRETWYDMLRIIAIFAVIMIHVSAENWYTDKLTINWLMNNFMNGLVKTWAVSLFVTISGSLLLDNKIKLNNLFKKYIPRILISLICWHIIYYFYSNPSFTLENIIICIKNLIMGKTYSHLWYLYMLIGLYLLSPILSKLVKNLTQKEFIYLLLFGFTITSILPTIDMLIPKYNLMKLISPYKVLDFNIYVFYYLLGYYLNKYNITKSKHIGILAIISIILWTSLDIIVSIKNGMPMTMFTKTNFVGILIVISLFNLFKNKFKNKENKYINLLGKLTYGVYLIHFIIEKELLKFGINSNMMNPIIGNLCISILILITSYIFSFIKNTNNKKNNFIRLKTSKRKITSFYFMYII